MAKGKNYSTNYFNNKSKKEGVLVIQTTEDTQNPIYAYGKGECYDFAKGHSGGQVFDITDCGARLLVFLENPTSREREQFKAEHPLEIKTIEVNDALFMLFKFGDLPWFEAPYNVHLSPHWNDMPSHIRDNSGFALNIHLYDTRDGQLLHNRLYTIPHDISVQILEVAKRQLNMEFNEAQYDQHLNETYAKYTTDQLVKLASSANDSESIEDVSENANSEINIQTCTENANQTTVFPDVNDEEAVNKYLKSLSHGFEFEMTDTGAVLKILALNPTKKELKQIFSAEKLLVKTLEVENVLYLLFKFGDFPWCVTPYNAYYDRHINSNLSLKENEELNLLIEVYDTSGENLIDNKQITLNTDISREIFNIIKRQLETPFNLKQYVSAMKTTLEQYLVEQLLILATSKPRFDSLDELEQEWQANHTGTHEPLYFNLNKPMTYQLASEMLEIAVMLKNTLNVECFFAFQDVRFHYKDRKLYGNNYLMPNSTKEKLIALFSETGFRCHMDFLNALGAKIHLLDF